MNSQCRTIYTMRNSSILDEIVYPYMNNLTNSNLSIQLFSLPLNNS